MAHGVYSYFFYFGIHILKYFVFHNRNPINADFKYFQRPFKHAMNSINMSRKNGNCYKLKTRKLLKYKTCRHTIPQVDYSCGKTVSTNTVYVTTISEQFGFNTAAVDWPIGHSSDLSKGR